MTSPQSKVVSAPRFYIDVGGAPVASFQEMSSLVSEVDAQEYIFCDTAGVVTHTKQYGKTKPPEVTLKRGFDDNAYLWTWHMRVRVNDPSAPVDATLYVVQSKPGATDPSQVETVMSFNLYNAWPKKLEVSGLKAGDSAVAVQSVVLVCDQIEFMPKGSSVSLAGA
ncbi:MAG TPA: phage tail protein [Pseudonocardiaceae bacterium]|jgi:phage tail-like protein|nr:phage tail protein [Pseudonocardiaceae bacterium]